MIPLRTTVGEWKADLCGLTSLSYPLNKNIFDSGPTIFSWLIMLYFHSHNLFFFDLYDTLNATMIQLAQWRINVNAIFEENTDKIGKQIQLSLSLRQSVKCAACNNTFKFWDCYRTHLYQARIPLFPKSSISHLNCEHFLHSTMF